MHVDVQAMKRYGIRPSEWNWYRTFGRVRIEPTSEYLAEVRRIRLRAAVLAVSDVGVVAVLMMVIQAVVQVRPSPASPASLVLIILLVGFVVLLGIMSRAREAIADARSRAVRLQHAPRIFGTPGGIRGAVARFGSAAEAGARGEESTAALLELLLCIPGTTVFHGVRFPGHDEADVDHAVTLGNAVYLIDSKLYRWGSYEWRSAGRKDLIVRSDGYGRGKANWMHTAADGYRSILGEEIMVVPLVMIHGRNTSVGPAGISEHGVRMLTARAAMESLGNALAVAAGAPENEAALRAMVSMLKGPASPSGAPVSEDEDSGAASGLD